MLKVWLWIWEDNQATAGVRPSVWLRLREPIDVVHEGGITAPSWSSGLAVCAQHEAFLDTVFERDHMPCALVVHGKGAGSPTIGQVQGWIACSAWQPAQLTLAAVY
jgi:hypothetical protein